MKPHANPDVARAAPTLARRRRERRIRSFFRHEQMAVKMAVISAQHHSAQRCCSIVTQTDDYVTASATFFNMSDGDDSDEPAAPVTEYVAPALDVTYAAPAPVIEYVPDDTCAAPAPVIKHVTFAPDDTNIAPASPRVNRDIRGLENPQFSIFAVQASASEVVDSCPPVGESALPVYKQVHREQIAAEQFVESAKEVTQERLPERIEVPNQNSLIPHSIVAPTPAREGPSRWKRHLAAQAPVIEHVTPAPVVSYSAPAPVIEDMSPEPGVPPVPAIEHMAPAPEIGYVASAQPVTFSVEQTVEQIIDLPGPSIARDTPELVSSSHDAAHAASASVVEYLVPVIECGSSSSSAVHAAPTRIDRTDEQLTNMLDMLDSYRTTFSRIEKETALLTKRYVEEAHQPSLTSPDGL